MKQDTYKYIILLSFIFLDQNLLARSLPDTGLILCADETLNIVICNPESASDDRIFPSQDGRYGRDAAAQANVLTKIGGGHAGFDYSKVCNSSQTAGVGTCPVNPILGSGTNDWGCTFDNVSGLLWEVKTTDNGLNNKDWRYSWFNSNSTTNGGNTGVSNGGVCVDGLSLSCDTEKYTAQVNASTLCGFTDWRLPSKRELFTLVNFNTSVPAIDISFFPNTVPSNYWSATPYVAHSGRAWYVNFRYGFTNALDKWNPYKIRLVRSGQPF